jgi:hypothetical protein
MRARTAGVGKYILKSCSDDNVFETSLVFRSCLTAVLPNEYFDINSILISCGMNILPSILPPLTVSSLFRRHEVFSPDDAVRALWVIVVPGIMSSIFAVVMAIVVKPESANSTNSANNAYDSVSGSSEHGGGTDNPMFVIEDARDEDDDGEGFADSDGDVEVVEFDHGSSHGNDMDEDEQ